MTPGMADDVTLRPVAEADMPVLERLTQDPAAATGWRDGAYRDGVWYGMLRTDQPG